jgi:hypothetical protein
MDIIIEATLKTLEKSKILLDNINDSVLSDATTAPYYSSVGSHLRHILDFYDCIFNINSENKIDLTARNRNLDVEVFCENASSYLDSIIMKLNSFKYNVDETIFVIDDLGLGKTEIPYTLGSLLAQANSHTIHHYAIINYILNGLKVDLKDSNFGYNPTTPKESV